MDVVTATTLLTPPLDAARHVVENGGGGLIPTGSRGTRRWAPASLDLADSCRCLYRWQRGISSLLMLNVLSVAEL